MTVQVQLAERQPEFKNLDWISTSVDPIVVLNKWYTPFPAAKNIKAFYLIMEQTNNGATVESIEVELTINGVVTSRVIAGWVSGTAYYIYFNTFSGSPYFTITSSTRQILSLDLDQSAPLETKSLQIRIRQTTAVDGVAANIEVNMVYAQEEESMTVEPLIACKVPEYANLDWISTSVDAIVVQNKWYTPLPTRKNVKAFYLIVEQTNNGAAAETIEFELTINGVIYASSVVANSGTPYYIVFTPAFQPGATGATRQMLTPDPDQSAPLETKSLQIRVRQTTAVDVVAANIEVNMVYLQVEETQVSEKLHDFKNLDWISTSVDAIVIQNKWYTPLTLTRDVKAYYLIVEQTNNGATNEDLEVELTIEGVTYTRVLGGGAVASGDDRYMYMSQNGIATDSAATRQMLSLDADQSAPLETKSLQIRVRQTSVVDAVAAQIEVNLVYEVLNEAMTVEPQLAQRIYEFKNLDYDTSGIANPVVQNDWYTALAETKDVEAWYIIVEQTNNGATVEDIEAELTINGVIDTVNLAGIASGAPRYLRVTPAGTFGDYASAYQLMVLDSDQSGPLETKSLMIRVRQTSVVDGVSAVLEVNMVYAQKEQT